MCVRASYMKLTRDTHLMQQFIYYYKQLYMFQASICPSSGVVYLLYYSIWCPALGVVAEVLRSRCVVGYKTYTSAQGVGYKTYTSAQDYTPAPQNLSHNT